MSVTDPLDGRTKRSRWLLVVAASVVAFGVWFLGALGDAPLGWDESVYALRGRAHLDATAPLTGWGLHRPPGLPVLSALIQLVAGSDAAVRLVGLVGAIVTAVASLTLVPRARRSPVAALAVAAVLTTPVLTRGIATGLSGVPSLALLLAGTALWASEVRDDDHVRASRMIAGGLVLGLAFLVRYGVLLPVVVSALAPMTARGVAFPRRMLVAVGAGLVGIGHAVWSIDQTGTPTGVLSNARRIAGTADPGATITAILEQLTSALIGWPALVIVVTALVVVAARRARLDLVDVTLLVMAVAAFAASITSDEYEARFFVVPVTMLTLVAASIVGEAVCQHLATRAAVLGTATLSAVLIVLGALIAPTSLDPRFADLREAARLIATEVEGAPCVVGSSRVPQVTWWSGCEVRPPSDVGVDAWLIESPWNPDVIGTNVAPDRVIDVAPDFRVQRPR